MFALPVTQQQAQPGPAFTGTPESLAGLFSKMAQVMAELAPVEKNGVNSYFNYKYIQQDEIYTILRAAMSTHGLAFLSSLVGVDYLTRTVGEGDRAKNKPLALAKFVFTIMDSDTGASISSPWLAEGIDTEDKALSKASAQATKYFLLRTFLIGAESDPDPDGHPGTQGTSSRPAKTTKGTQQQSTQAQGSDPRLEQVPQNLKAYAPSSAKDWTTIYSNAPGIFGVDKNYLAGLAAKHKADAIGAFLDLVSQATPSQPKPAPQPAPQPAQGSEPKAQGLPEPKPPKSKQQPPAQPDSSIPF